MRVKAFVVRAAGEPATLEGLDLDEPREGEILVRLVASGVARVDCDAVAGRLAFAAPFVPGSEGAGIVERAGPGVDRPAPGESVLVTYAACGECPACDARDLRNCHRFAALNLSGLRPDGSTPLLVESAPVHGFFFGQSSFATHLVCRAADVVPVAATVPLEAVAALGGEFLTGAAPVLRWAPNAGDAIVVTGATVIGLAACMVARALGVGTIVVADPDEERRKLALDLGATLAVPADEGLAAVVRSVKAEGARLALEASGHESALVACLASLGNDAVCVAVRPPTQAPVEGSEPLVLGADVGVDAHGLVPRLIELVQQGRLPVEQLISYFAFEHVSDALQALASEAVVKPVLRFSLGPFGALDRALTEGAASEETGEPSPSVPEPSRQDADLAPDAPETAGAVRT